MRARVSVIMPTYDQEAFLPTAVASVFAQEEQDWELVVVDDGSPGDTAAALGPALEDPRVRLHRSGHNQGLGAALNAGLALSSGDLVAYLPSDDLWFTDHLSEACRALEADPRASLCCAGVAHGVNSEIATGRIDGEPLQLVQVVHRRTTDRWVERAELTTDDLDRMLWARLLRRGPVVFTHQVTCQWTSHPAQRSRVLREPRGGLNPYRARYDVREPLVLHSTAGQLHDEVELYREMRSRPPVAADDRALRILLVGELAHNPERVVALTERGHTLYGLWTEDPWWFNTVGPVPFGGVTDVPRAGWLDAVRAIRPDLIYALLNWQAIDIAQQVLDGIRSAGLPVPFVWHLKEGPFEARQHGLWPALVDLHLRSDGQIYSSEELRRWFAAVVPGSAAGRSTVLDGDLPKADWLRAARRGLLSEADGEMHTVIPGRPMGPQPVIVGALAARGVHVHLYGEKVQVQMRDWVQAARRHAPHHLHLHRHVTQRDWVAEFSRYDAGWLHDFTSGNGGDIRAATWNDLNVPARVATLAVAGVPLILRDNPGSVVAVQRLLASRRLGVLWSDPDDLAEQLHDLPRLASLRAGVWRQRHVFTFDAHVGELEAFFRSVIADVRGAQGSTGDGLPASPMVRRRRGSGPASPPRVPPQR
jgi:Glycosyl transferase family 2